MSLIITNLGLSRMNLGLIILINVLLELGTNTISLLKHNLDTHMQLIQYPSRKQNLARLHDN